jgi:hypothetical protein
MKIALALLLCLFSGSAWSQPSIVGPGQAVLCTGIAVLPSGSTGLTQIVAAITNARVYICGWHITNTASSGTWALGSGTGTNCGTGGVSLIPAQNVSSNAPSADHIDFASLQTGISQALCLNPSVNTISGLIYFNQF